MAILKKIGNVFLYTVISVLLVWTAYIAVAGWVQPTKYPMLFGWGEAGIASGSMEPALSQGDHVLFRKQDSYEVNDVIVYYDEEEKIFVVHRIVGESDGAFITQGDFNSACDPAPVKEENVQGKVMHVIPNLQSFLLIGLGILITLVLQDLGKCIGAFKKKRKGGKKADEGKEKAE